MAVGALALGVLLAACSGGAGRNLAGPAAPTVPPGATAGPEATVAEPADPVPPPTDPPVTGVPGLDSDDAFCSAWSRFAGSFQVVAVAAAFAGDPAAAFELEVTAAPVVERAYADLAANWPDEISAERDTVLTYVFGGFAGRAGRAVEQLRAAGGDDAALDAIAAGWLDALSRRDPENPLVDVRLAGGDRSLVTLAASGFGASNQPVNVDPALVSEVPTPAFDAYLARTCPDEGLLAGNEVG